MTQNPLGSSWIPALGALFFSSVFCSFLLVLMAQTQNQPIQKEPTELLVRTLNVVEPPPPIKPQKNVEVEQQINVPRLSSPKTNSKVMLETTPIDLEFELDFDPTLVLVEHGVDFDHEIEADVGVALKTHFEFEDMDQPPRLMHDGGFRFTFPKDLIRRNIRQGKVELSIQIDQTGKAKVLSVVSAQYEQLIPLARRMISMVKFSVPTVQGKMTKVTGIWPVVLQAPQ